MDRLWLVLVHFVILLNTFRTFALSSDETVVGVRAEIPNVEDKETQLQQPDDVTGLQCGIWLAPSTIKGAGLGMYAGRSFTEGDYFQEFGDIVIPIVDIEEHAAEYSEEKWTFLWDEYTWDAENLRMDSEGLFGVNSASPGFGAAANSFLGIFNVEEYNPTVGTNGLHRSKDPGVGAFSPYHDRKSSAKRDIEAGEELFVSYGENWFETRQHFGPVPLFDELDKATALAKSYHKMSTQARLPKEAKTEFWNTFVRKTVFDESRTLGSFRGGDEDELNKLKSVSLKDIRIQESTRSLEWLAQYGTCGDHIVAGPSTVEQAGHGGFASRMLPAGTVVSHLPLIHVTDRERLVMYNFEKDEEDKLLPSQDEGVLSYQLMLNYCFGHSESTLLLCPYGPMTSYINHNLTSANLELRWADPNRGNHNPELLTKNISSLEADATAKLAFELVATRDIRQGEELFLSYGDDWEIAWQNHVAAWRPQVDDDYVPAWEMNQDRSSRLRTEFEEMESQELPENLQLRCNKVFAKQNKESWQEHVESGTILSYTDEFNMPMLPCEVLRYTNASGQFLYTVVMYEDDEEDTSQLVNHLVEGIPRDGMNFFDRPYTSDITQPSVFRHDIRVPDDIFPKAWRNKL